VVASLAVKIGDGLVTKTVNDVINLIVETRPDLLNGYSLTVAKNILPGLAVAVATKYRKRTK